MCMTCPSEAPITARGLCKNCYYSFRRRNQLSQFPVKSSREKFDSHYTKGEFCWLWHGALNDAGYGQWELGSSGRKLRAHRVMWTLTFGPIPKGLYVCHSCDVRNCVNPTHLFLGTVQDNLRDCREKGRHARGQTNGHAKLTDKQILAIIADQRPQALIAKEYRIHQSEISRIKSRKRWTHVSLTP